MVRHGYSLVIACALAGAAHAQSIVIDSPVRAESLNDESIFTPVRIDIDALRALCTDEVTLVRHFPIGRGRTLDLEITPFDIFTPDASVVIGTEKGDMDIGRPDVVLLRGRVAGDESSAVFLGVAPDMAHGSIRVGDETFYLSSGPWINGGPTMVYNAADLPPGSPPPVIPCGTDHLAQFGGEFDVPREPAPRGGFPCRTARIAVDTVWEHTRDVFAGDPHAALMYDTILMAAISEIYHRDFNMHIAVPYMRAWAGNTDPYDVAADDVLGQFRAHWSANMGHISRTLAHIFTTSGLNGAGGVAWLGVVCSNSWGYAASGYLGGSFPYPLTDHHAGNWDLVVAAHEIGHNFGAPHTHSYNPPLDGCGNGDCSQPYGGTIMSYCHTCAGGMTNIVLHFHPENLATMNSYLQSAGGCSLVNQAYPTPDYDTALRGTPITIDVLANDNIGSCGEWSIASFNSSSINNGTITRSVGTGPGGRDELIYTSSPGFSGTDRFNYTVSMPGRANQTTNVNVRVVQARSAVLVAHPMPGANAAYYQLSNPSALPDFSTLTPYRTVTVPSVNYPSTNGLFANSLRSDQVGAVFTGYIQVPETGFYTLSVESDDGSRLFIGNDMIVDNDGLHGMEERSARVALEAGMHPIRVEFFENGGGAGCIVRWQSDTIARQPIPSSRWFRGEVCTVDWDASGAVNSQDFFEFLNDFFAGSADYNNSGATDSQDLFDFLAAFFTGC